jgi:hypothetical protein
MTVSSTPIVVRSHVGRDLLQSAALFKTDKQVIWEYVVNGLEYTDEGTNPVVRVKLESTKRRLAISDNGRGMDWDGLNNFFIMHGENVDRLHGKARRGFFGTDKSAAFGIAELLRVTSVQNGLRSMVQLTRSDVQKAVGEHPIPVQELECNVPTNQPNGTLIEIEGVHLRSFDQKGIIRYIERHLAHWSRNAKVYVNNHECEFTEPVAVDTRTYPADSELFERAGNVPLILKVAAAPLDEDLCGVAIFSNGVWYETTLAGSKGREMSEYIFGEIDIPCLEKDDSPIAPFDLSRSMTLNPQNEPVQAVYASIEGEKGTFSIAEEMENVPFSP